MKKIIRASYEDKFWELYHKDRQTEKTLESIVDDLGLKDKFYNYKLPITEAEYKAVVDAYLSSTGMSVEELSYLIEELSLQVGVADMILYIAKKTSSVREVVKCLKQLADDNGIEI